MSSNQPSVLDKHGLVQFVSVVKSMKAKRRDVKYRIKAAKDQAKSIRACIQSMTEIENVASATAFKLQQKFNQKANQAEYRFRKAVIRSLTGAADLVTTLVRNNTIILCDPTVDFDTNYLNLVAVRSVDFEAGTIDFESESVQEVWNQMKDLFRVESCCSKYNVRKEVVSNTKQSVEDRWVIRECTDHDFGFFKRLRHKEIDSDLDHSDFVSLCHSTLDLDLTAFDDVCIKYVNDDPPDVAKSAEATIKFIALNPIVNGLKL